MTNNVEASLYVGQVWHKRWRPIVHTFRYSVFYLLVDINHLANPDRHNAGPWCLSFDRFNLFSIHEKDYLDKDSDGLRKQIGTALADAGIDEEPAKVMLLTMPRVLGYAFNPINIYYCLQADDSVSAVLYEVNNTFGERHNYAFQAGQGQSVLPNALSPHQADKNFHVSPFFPVKGQYRFRQSLPEESISLAISYRDQENRPLLSTTLSGQRAHLDSINLLALFFKIPFLGFKVTAAIHVQAARLWLKGLAFWRKPIPPRQVVTGATPLKQ